MNCCALLPSSVIRNLLISFSIFQSGIKSIANLARGQEFGIHHWNNALARCQPPLGSGVKMPTLSITNFNIVCATLGGFITLFGLVSYLFKERFYLSEACKSLKLPLMGG